MSCPWKDTDPSVMVSSRRRHRPRVDLPQPDSPTTPKISPLATDRETPPTAWSSLGFSPSLLEEMGKFLTRPAAWMTASLMAGQPSRSET